MSKKKKNKKDKKPGKSGDGPVKGLKKLAQNPLVADVVAAALVATASALKDSKRARALASEAGDDIAKLSKAGAERGNALWDMALQIGRRSLETLSGDAAPKRSRSKSPKQESDRKEPSKKKKKRPSAPAK